MNIIKYNHENLVEMRELVGQLSDEQYRESLSVLSGASIGQHVRHILEFYVCLLKTQSSGVICYDERERDARIETDRYFAITAFEDVMLALKKINSDRPLRLRANFSSNEKREVVLDTSLFRELAYDLEHSIHHQALIKIGLDDLREQVVTTKSFGVAPSTIRHRSG